MQFRTKAHAISVGPSGFYVKEPVGSYMPTAEDPPKEKEKTPGAAVAAMYASLPRRQRRKIDRDAKRALRKYRKAGLVKVQTETHVIKDPKDAIYEVKLPNSLVLRGTRAELEARGITFTGAK